MKRRFRLGSNPQMRKRLFIMHQSVPISRHMITEKIPAKTKIPDIRKTI